MTSSVAAAAQVQVWDFAAPQDPARIGVLLACGQCGGWTVSGRSCKLRAPCGAPSAAGKDVLGRLARGCFPKGDSRYEGVLVARPTPLAWGISAAPGAASGPEA